MTRTGVHSGLEKHRFHQAEEARSPDLRKAIKPLFCTCLHKRGVLIEVRQKGYFFSNSNTKCKTVVRL